MYERLNSLCRAFVLFVSFLTFVRLSFALFVTFVAAAIRRSPYPINSVCAIGKFVWSVLWPVIGLSTVFLHGCADELHHCTVALDCSLSVPAARLHGVQTYVPCCI